MFRKPFVCSIVASLCLILVNAGVGYAQPFGACCLDNGECIRLILESECALQEGTFQGVGTECSPGTCQVKRGH